MKIGAHVSISGGIPNAILNATKIGANTIQIFLSAPQNWNSPKITDQEAEQFLIEAKKNNIDPVVIHAIYLINLASSNPDLIEKSKKTLIDYLNTSAAIQSIGVIFHIGSSKEKTFDEIKKQVIDNIDEILDQSDPKSTLIIETNAGQGNCIGSTFEQIFEIISGIKQKSRIAVCLDTAHIYESGYDLKSDPKKIIQEFNKIIGLNYLKTIHCNDSKTTLNSKVDRHENIGQGELGENTFKTLLHMPELKEIPFIIEVPGFENKGPDKQNIDLLKKLA